MRFASSGAYSSYDPVSSASDHLEFRSQQALIDRIFASAYPSLAHDPWGRGGYAMQPDGFDMRSWPGRNASTMMTFGDFPVLATMQAAFQGRFPFATPLSNAALGRNAHSGDLVAMRGDHFANDTERSAAFAVVGRMRFGDGYVRPDSLSRFASAYRRA